MSQEVLHLPQIPAIALDTLSDVTAPTPSVGDLLVWTGSAWVSQAPSPSITANQRRASIVFQFGDGVTAIAPASEREQWIECNFTGTLEGWSLTADISGSIVVDVWKDTYANYPPIVGDSMVGAGTKPTLSSQLTNRDTTLTSWSTAITRGDTIKVHVDSATTLKAVTLTLLVIKT